MKADRRHELQENELAVAITQARDFLGHNARTISIAIGAVVLVAILASFAVRSRVATREDQWRRFSQLDTKTPEKAREALPTLQALAREASDESFRMTALSELGRSALRLSQESDAPPDRAMLETARDAFDQLRTRFPRSPLAVSAGHLGLATIAEDMFLLTRDENQRTEARRHLTAVIEDPKAATLPVYRLAVDRRNALDATLTLVAFAPPDAAAAPIPTPELEPMEIDDETFNAMIKVQTPDGQIKTIKPGLDVKLPPGKAIPEPTPEDEKKPEGNP